MENRHKAWVKHRISHTPNALKATDDEAFQLIVYCFQWVRRMRSATFDPDLNRFMIIHNERADIRFKEHSTKTYQDASFVERRV